MSLPVILAEYYGGFDLEVKVTRYLRLGEQEELESFN